MNNREWDSYEVISNINKSKTKKIIIAKATKREHSGIDIREFYFKDNNYLPGKGVFVPDHKFDQFMEELKKIGP